MQDTVGHQRSGLLSLARGRMQQRATIMVILTLVASAINYGSNIIFSHVLDPAGYGELTALFALSVVLAVPTAAAQTVIAERAAVYTAEGRLDRVRYLLRHALAHVSVLAGVVGVLYLVFTPAIVPLLGLRHYGVALALAPVLMLAFLQPVMLGVLQGLERYVTFGVMLLLVALSRILFGVPWAAVEHGPGGALGGQAVGMLVVLAVAAWIMRDLLIGGGTGAARTGLRRRPDMRTMSASAAFAAFAVLSNLDIVLAKIFLDGDQAGQYAALATVGKIIIFLPAAIAVVMVPNAAKAHHSQGSSATVLRTSALLVGVTTLLAAIPAIAAPHLIIQLMFGHKYTAASGGVLPIVVAGAGLAMTYLLVVYAVTISDRRWGFLLILGVALQICGIAAFHGSPAQVATVQAAVALAVLGCNEILFHPIVYPKAGYRRRSATLR